jgi:5'(3')-deoxyribonucleotidase
MAPGGDRYKSFQSFVSTIFIVVITVGVERSAGAFQSLPNPGAAMLVVGILFVALSWVYYHISVEDDRYDGTPWSWVRFCLDVAIAFSYIGLFLTIGNAFAFGEVLTAIYLLYGTHGLSTVRQVGWYRATDSGVRPASLPAFWFLVAPLFALSGWLLSPVNSGPSWELYIPPIVFGLEICLSRWLRHWPSDWAYRGLVGLKLEPPLSLAMHVKLQSPCVVAVDVDGTLADQVPHVLERAEYERKVRMTKSQITEWDTPVGGEPFDKMIHRYLQDPEFVKTMPPISHAANSVNLIRGSCEVFVASSRPTSTESATMDWLVAQLGWRPPFVNTTASGKKALAANILIDDSDRNLVDFVSHVEVDGPAAWPRPLRAGILLKQPWNGKAPELLALVPSGRIHVAANWDEVLRVMGLRDNGPGSG